MTKKEFRKIRSSLKQRIRRGSDLNYILRQKYNLVGYVHTHKILLRTKNTETITIPDVFCLIQDHEKALNFLNSIDELLNSNTPYNLKFNHHETVHIGLSASFLFDKKIKRYKRKWESDGYRIRIQGIFSKEKEVNNFLVSFGLLYELEIKYFDKRMIDFDYKSKYLTKKYRGSKNSPEKKGDISIKLTDYFQECFNFNGFLIEENAYRNIIHAFSEILGNAEEHCGNNLPWYAFGHFNKETSICSFSIINYGMTVFDSLSNNESTAREVLEEIEKVVRSNYSLFSRIIGNYPRQYTEVIYNFMALQDGISSKRPEEGKGSSRGQGLLEMLEFIDAIRSDEDQTELCLLSGRSKILIDFEYPIIKKEICGKKVRQIIFNNEKDLLKLQDQRKAILMNDSFPGVILTGKFKINRKYLEDLIKDNGK